MQMGLLSDVETKAKGLAPRRALLGLLGLH